MPVQDRHHRAVCHRVEFTATEPERVEAYVSDTYRSEIRISVCHEDYRFRHVELESGPFRIDTFDHRATTETYSDPLPGICCVFMHHGLRVDVDLDEQSGPGDLFLNGQPGRQLHTRSTSAQYTVVFVPMPAVAEVARNRPDDELPLLHFATLRPRRSADARHWLTTVEYVTECLRTTPEAMAQPLLHGPTTRLLAATLLTTFPNTWTSEPHRVDRTDATPTTLSRAIAFIDTNADYDISTVDIARAAYATVRAVQLAFRRHLDTTPVAYLRRVRLERANAQLRAASWDDGTTVTQVAARWGFADPSRFAIRYREAFGELPSQTLRT